MSGLKSLIDLGFSQFSTVFLYHSWDTPYFLFREDLLPCWHDLRLFPPLWTIISVVQSYVFCFFYRVRSVSSYDSFCTRRKVSRPNHPFPLDVTTCSPSGRKDCVGRWSEPSFHPLKFLSTTPHSSPVSDPHCSPTTSLCTSPFRSGWVVTSLLHYGGGGNDTGKIEFQNYVPFRGSTSLRLLFFLRLTLDGFALEVETSSTRGPSCTDWDVNHEGSTVVHFLSSSK